VKDEVDEPTSNIEPQGDVDDAGENLTSPPPVETTAALKFCSKRSVDNGQ